MTSFCESQGTPTTSVGSMPWLLSWANNTSCCWEYTYFVDDCLEFIHFEILYPVHAHSHLVMI